MSKKKIIALLTAVGGLLLPFAAGAATIVPSCATGSDVPGLNCIMQTLGNIAQLILAVAGGLTLLMFVYGGFLMLASAGAEERVRKGKDTLKAALIGLAIILLSGYLVNYGLRQLRVDADYIEEQQPTNSNPE